MSDDAAGPDIALWFERFNRAMLMFSEAHEADGFNDLVAVSVAGITLEAILGLGIAIQEPTRDLSRMTLGGHITIALENGLVPELLRSALVAFRDIRNGFAHYVDYRLDAATIDDLYQKMPPEGRARIDHAQEGIVSISPGMHFRLTLMTLFALTDRDVRANVTKLLDERGVPR